MNIKIIADRLSKMDDGKLVEMAEKHVTKDKEKAKVAVKQNRHHVEHQLIQALKKFLKSILLI